jgi:hypothetical protein
MSPINDDASARKIASIGAAHNSYRAIEATKTCSTCRYPSWEDKVSNDEEFYVICNSFNDLIISAEAGCLGCRILEQSWALETPKVADRAAEYLSFTRCGYLSLRLFRGQSFVNIDVFTLSQAPRFKHIRPASLVPHSTSLEHNLPKIQLWLRECEQQHTSCNIMDLSIPPRLLDLDTASSGTVRIVQGVDVFNITRNRPSSLNLRYACLSHCWGQTRSKHLTRHHNLDQNLAAILISELPCTFQDAINICQALSIRYLWIDSLCIVQDNKNDWEIHVELMAQIYRNAYITLGAGASSDDDGGFFNEAKDSNLQPHCFTLNTEGKEYNIYIRRSLPHPNEDSPSDPEMPLMTRGWVFQEWLLSKRYLCFGRHEVLWECREDVACSCSTTATAFNHHLSAKPCFPRSESTKFDFTSVSELSKNDLWSLWRQLVTHYSERRLTFPTDKLPALAGLASTFELAGAGAYLHGQWVEGIDHILLWHSLSEVAEWRPRIAPSWSWISAVDGKIQWEQSGLFRSKWNAIGILHQDPAEHNDSDNTYQNALCLEGNLAHVCLEVDSGTSWERDVFPGYRVITMTSASNLTLVFEPPPDELFSEQHNTSYTQVDYHGDLFTDYKFWSDEPDLQSTMTHIYFLELGIEQDEIRYNRDSQVPCWVAGVLLRNVDHISNVGVPYFERIAWLRFCTNGSEEQWKSLGSYTKLCIV